MTDQPYKKQVRKQISLATLLKGMTMNKQIKRMNDLKKRTSVKTGRHILPLEPYMATRQLWNPDTMSEWCKSESLFNGAELTAVFDDNVFFLMNSDYGQLVKSRALSPMSIIQGDPYSVINILHSKGVNAFHQAIDTKEFEFSRKWLTSYQEIANYLVSEKGVPNEQYHLVESLVQIKRDWKLDINAGVNFALNKKQAIQACEALNESRTKSVLMYSDGKVIFFVTKGIVIGLPPDFTSISWSKPGTTDEIMEANSCHGKFLFTTHNVNEYLNAHYPRFQSSL